MFVLLKWSERRRKKSNKGFSCEIEEEEERCSLREEEDEKGLEDSDVLLAEPLGLMIGSR